MIHVPTYTYEVIPGEDGRWWCRVSRTSIERVPRTLFRRAHTREVRNVVGFYLLEHREMCHNYKLNRPGTMELHLVGKALI